LFTAVVRNAAGWQSAAPLVLTVGAVEKHIASIFTKTGSDHRRVLAVLAHLQQD